MQPSVEVFFMIFFTSSNNWLSGIYLRHGAQGELNTASKSTLENEFGTSVDEGVIKQILEKGSFQESQVIFPSSTSLRTQTYTTYSSQREPAPRTTAWERVLVTK